MSEFTDRLKQEFKGFWPDVQRGMRERRDAEIDEACYVERQENIATATLAMLDAGLADAVIEEMLCKYWDLRRSEVPSFLDWAHNQIDKQQIK